MAEKKKKKQGFLSKLFGGKKYDDDEESSSSKKKEDNKKLQKHKSVETSEAKEKPAPAATKKPPPPARSKSSESNGAAATKSGQKSSGSGGAKPKSRPKRGGKARRKKKDKRNVQIDLSKGLAFPCTPEVVLEYHKNKPILNASEEWLIVELNEFECLIDSMDIVKIIAKHSKFFEVEPDELWEEFFEWVDDIAAYDEVINYDIWQEFRDKKYPM